VQHFWSSDVFISEPNYSSLSTFHFHSFLGHKAEPWTTYRQMGACLLSSGKWRLAHSSVYVITIPSGPWPLSEDTFFHSSLSIVCLLHPLFLGSVTCPSGRRPPSLLLLFCGAVSSRVHLLTVSAICCVHPQPVFLNLPKPTA